MPWGDNQGDHPGPWGSQPSGSGGQGGNQPPDSDIEEMLRRLQAKFMQTFQNGGSNFDNGKGLVLAAIIVVLLWLSSGIYFVHADEQGVVMRFGQYVRTTAPGVNYHLPYPIETVETPRVTAINHVEIGYRSAGMHRNSENAIAEESLMLTGDENIVDIDFEVQWKISNAPDFLFNVRNPEETVKAVSESAMREVVGKSQIANILAEGKLQVEIDTKKLIQDTLNQYQSGIEVVAVNLLMADPPAEVIDSFRDVQTARADLETARNQAEAYSNDILPKARGQAQQMILEAEGYKQQVIADAQGQASRFSAIYNEYKQAKDVTKKRMYLETMENILEGMNKVIIDKGSGTVPYLPLPELKPTAGESSR